MVKCELCKSTQTNGHLCLFTGHRVPDTQSTLANKRFAATITCATSEPRDFSTCVGQPAIFRLPSSGGKQNDK